MTSRPRASRTAASPLSVAASGVVEQRLVAVMDDPDNADIPNIIHSTSGALAYGYDAALVGGVTAYGWTVPAIRRAVGDRWLDDGWIDIAFRRPIYPGDALTIRLQPQGDAFSLTVDKEPGGRAILATLGLGQAPWAGQLALPTRRRAAPARASLPRLTPAIAPLGQDLAPMAVDLSAEQATAFALTEEGDGDPLWAGARPRIHPAWLAGRATPLLHHSYDYGPSIHTRSQIQHLAPGFAGETVTVAGRFVDAYERKGRAYAVLDCLLLGAQGQSLAALRHTTIYQLPTRPARERPRGGDGLLQS